jgi:hypothetical protein
MRSCLELAPSLLLAEALNVLTQLGRKELCPPPSRPAPLLQACDLL